MPNSGSGYGNVLTLLNAQNTSGNGSDGIEANCDIVSGGGAVSSCTGPWAGKLTLNDPANQNHAQTLAATGITDSSTAASQLRLVFNVNQTGSDTTLTLDGIGLALWYNGTNIWSTYTTRNDTYDAILQGVGQAGFGYQLTAAQAQSAQMAINTALGSGATLNSILITGAFQAGCLTGSTGCGNDGPDNLFVTAQGATVTAVPEPASIVGLGTALMAMAALARRKRRA